MLTSFTAKPAPADSLDWYLAQANVKTFVLDFRSGNKNDDIVNWINAPHPMRSIGSGYVRDTEESYFYPAIITQEFDGLFFIDTTTRARPNPSVKNVAPAQ